MISTLFKSLKLTVAFCILLSVCYIFILWLFAQVAGPNKGNAAVIELNGKVVGATHVGQPFTQDIYFWGRPSHAGDGYDASSSGGSNKGPSNEAYLADVEARIDTFLWHHPYLKREEVPAEMVTASGSGLDPDISPKAAYAQAKRVAEARGIAVDKVMALVNAHIEGPLLGLFGPQKVNVLKLNVALEKAVAKNHEDGIK
ncbi:K(+)-transporting ATPase subunit C [Parabacteroides bouchesdurhonensis]|uniref:K(+)-transporting ATPase subunit C n=1 Tax=Parabacteroides bouchesdurhonensis TaxID=1936995 RepID=UPI000C815F66|nr:K(+)-transporting ATPase subunit C [Parabacteroides bouchesdurhonensis]